MAASLFSVPFISALVSGTLVCVHAGLTTGSDARLSPFGKLGLGIILTVDVQV